MQLTELLQLATSMGLRGLEGLNRVEVARAIQRSGGTLPCFAQTPFTCGQEGCGWRPACYEEHALRSPASRRSPHAEHHCCGHRHFPLARVA